MLAYMLDTDISSYFMNRSNQNVLSRLEEVSVEAVCISAITKAELLFGVHLSPRRAKNQAALDLFLRHVLVLDFPAGAAEKYAEIRAELKKRGAMIGANDLLIAAHALYENLVLVTNNTREFERITTLKLANWTEPLR